MFTYFIYIELYYQNYIWMIWIITFHFHFLSFLIIELLIISLKVIIDQSIYLIAIDLLQELLNNQIYYDKLLLINHWFSLFHQSKRSDNR